MRMLRGLLAVLYFSTFLHIIMCSSPDSGESNSREDFDSEELWCNENEYRCLDGSCAVRGEYCNDNEVKTSEGCPMSTPVKCQGEDGCILLSDQCNHFCDCKNCSDEDPTHCDFGVSGDMEEAKFFPTSTLLLAGFAFVMWSIYVYFKRKMRMSRYRNQAILHTEEPSGTSIVTNGSAPTVSLATDQSAQNNALLSTNRTFNISIDADSDSSSSEDTIQPVGDAPPSYSEAMANPTYNQQSQLPQQETIPPPPSYDTATGNSAQNRNSSPA